jgi:hypothetical protein
VVTHAVLEGGAQHRTVRIWMTNHHRGDFPRLIAVGAVVSSPALPTIRKPGVFGRAQRTDNAVHGSL